MIYLDYAATTPIDEDVLNTYIRIQNTFFANPNSLHKLGLESHHMYEVALNDTLNTLGLTNHTLLYTSNATLANNIGIYGYVLGKKGRVITTKIEHPSVYEIFKDLETKGYDVVYLDVDNNGLINLDELKQAMNNETILVSIMWVNNIIGTIEPIKDIIQIVKQYPKCKLHVDAVQGLCKVVPDFDLNDLDMFTFSTHKIYGPKGIGGLFVKKNIKLEKLLHGSYGQEGIIPGTIDIALIASTAKAFKKFYPRTKEDVEKVTKLNNYLKTNLNNPHIFINSPNTNYSPYIISLSLPNIKGETIVRILEENDVIVSTGASCSSKLAKPEKTILAVTNDKFKALGSIRISFSHLTTLEEVKKITQVLNEIKGE